MADARSSALRVGRVWPARGGYAAAEIVALPRALRTVIVQERSILIPVLLCIALTQLAWYSIYDCTVTKNLLFFTGDNSLGGDAVDGMANTAIAMSIFALVIGVLLTLALYRFKKIVEAWLALSSILCSVVITGTLFSDGVARLPIDETSQLAIVASLIAAYSSGSVLAFLTRHMPTWFRQMFMITNCASMATFYLTFLPDHTTWFLLVAVAVWDIFSALAPLGPLRLAIDLADEYSADMLRFLMYSTEGSQQEEEKKRDTVSASGDAAAAESSAKGDEVAEDREEAIEDTEERGIDESVVHRRLSAGADALEESVASDASSGHADDSEGAEPAENNNNNNNNNNSGEERSALDALNSGSHLGFGDFIFYSILVGKSLSVGFLPALVSTVGVLVGLAWTMSLDGVGQETFPALPISIAFGMIGHFSTVAQMAALEYLYSICAV